MNRTTFALIAACLLLLQKAEAQEYATEAYLLRIKKMIVHELSAVLNLKPEKTSTSAHHGGRGKKSKKVESAPPISMPLENNRVCFTSTCLVDEHVGKEALYKAALNWYLQTFPYAYKDLMVENQAQGKILGRCSYTLKDPDDRDETIRISFLVALTVRYKKCQLSMYGIQSRYEGSWKNSKTGMEESLDEVYEAYSLANKGKTRCSSSHDRYLRLINTYFSERCKSFQKSIKDLTNFVLKSGF